jgi:hypothetical protein
LHANIAGILYLQKSMLKIDSSAIRPISATGTLAGRVHIELHAAAQLNGTSPTRQAAPPATAPPTRDFAWTGPDGCALMRTGSMTFSTETPPYVPRVAEVALSEK